MKFISSTHYDDIVTERAIVKLCGYPLCHEEKGEEIKQQFKISTKNNRVYDLTERKNYCSQKCMKHSSFLKEQISQTPLWLRNQDEKSVIFYDERKKTEDRTECSGQDHIDTSHIKKPSKSKREKQMKKINDVKIDLWALSSEALQEWFTLESAAMLRGELPKDDRVAEPKAPIDEETNETIKKIEAFYKGSTELFSMKDLTIQEKPVEDSRTPVVPIVDKVSQITLQRRILMESIERGFSSIGNILPVSWANVKPELKRLVSTFKLTSSNIVIKQKAWPLVSVCLLHLLLCNTSSPLGDSTEIHDFAENFVSELGVDPQELESLRSKLMKGTS